jgi:hypothetical protein
MPDSKEMIVITDAWDAIKAATQENAVKSAVQLYSSFMQQGFKSPVSVENFYSNPFCDTGLFSWLKFMVNCVNTFHM